MLTLSKLKQVSPSFLAQGRGGKKPSPARIAMEIKKLVKELGGDPESINAGDCDRFAEELVSRLQYGDAYETVAPQEDDFDNPVDFDGDMEDLPNHAFVEIDGRYYDAEAPGGVANWWELPVYKRFDFKEETSRHHFLGNVPLIGQDTFEEWLTESHRRKS